MKRYALHHKDAPPDGRQCSAEMFEIAKGAYVLYSDHARVVEAADRMSALLAAAWHHVEMRADFDLSRQIDEARAAYDAAKKGGTGE